MNKKTSYSKTAKSSAKEHKENKPEKRNYLQIVLEKINQFIENKPWIIFIGILIVGLYLRFYRIEETVAFGWDQGRDAWVVRQILQGEFTLIGPRTGVGHFHLGPVYYYLLAPFYFLTNLDPMASNYFNILANIINFVSVFYVTKKLFSNKAAIFVTLIFATSQYLMGSRIPWNVTLMPGVAALIFYSIMKVYQGDYRWVFAAWGLSGFFFNIHFTALFLPIIVAASFLWVKDKLLVLKYSLLSIPLYCIWFVPNIVYELQGHNNDYRQITNFFEHYYIGLHFRFMLHRLPDSLVQFGTILNYPPFSLMKYVVPLVFFATVLITRNKKDMLFAYLISLWFVIPLVGFTLYGGPLSDYYFLFGVPMVLWMIWYLQDKILQRKSIVILLISIIFWSLYVFHNTKNEWVKSDQEGLHTQKETVKQDIAHEQKIDFKEGDIRSYLYIIWTEDGKRF